MYAQISVMYSWIPRLGLFFPFFFPVGFNKKSFYYHLTIFRKYEFSQNLEGVAQKVRPPHPFQF